MKVAIVTDTNSGIFKQEGDRLGIHVIPMPVLIDNNVFYEGENITEDELYAALRQGSKVFTSQPAPGDIMELWDGLLKNGYDQVVYIPMSSGLSSACSVAKGFAEDYENKVFVVDNHRISVTLKQAAFCAQRLAAKGADGAQIADFLEKDAYNASIYLTVSTLEYLKRGGRVTPAAAAIGTLLNIKPILSIQGGRLDAHAKVRGSISKCIEKMIEMVKLDIDKRFADAEPDRLRIGLAGAGVSAEDQESAKGQVKEAFPFADIYYDPLPLSICTHTGPGAIGVSVTLESD